MTESCKPWDASKWVGMVAPPEGAGFFKFKFSLNPPRASAGTTFGNDGTPITDDAGAAVPQARAVGLGSPEEITIRLPESTTDRVVRMRWINDWCDRGVPYGCSAPGDGIGHDLNLVIQRILVDTDTAAGRCEKLEAPDGSTVWPVETIVAPILKETSPYTPSTGSGSSPVATPWPDNKIGATCAPNDSFYSALSTSCGSDVQQPDTSYGGVSTTSFLPCGSNGKCVRCDDAVNTICAWAPIGNSGGWTHAERCNTSSGLCVGTKQHTPSP